MTVTLTDQMRWTIRCDWGEDGVAALSSVCDVAVVVDVQSFSTSVLLATARGAIVFPFAREQGV